jgi:hypothetical protein
MLVLSLAFVWFMSPLGLGFYRGAGSVRLEIADGMFRFSYFILNPAMVLVWAALPWFHHHGQSGFGWRLLGFIAALLCATVFTVLWLIGSLASS